MNIKIENNMKNLNREIKFRAWDGLHQKFSYWTMNDLCTWDTKKECPSALEDWSQFTGLKDKSGREIYEGDILGGSVIPTIVEWEKVGWSPFYYEDHIDPKEVEVIGNIYEYE